MSELSVPNGPGSISNLRKVMRGQESCVTWATCCCPFLFHSEPTENTNTSIRALGFIQLHEKLNEMHVSCFSFLQNQRRGLVFVIKMMTPLDNCVMASSKGELSRETTGKWDSALKGYNFSQTVDSAIHQQRAQPWTSDATTEIRAQTDSHVSETCELSSMWAVLFPLEPVSIASNIRYEGDLSHTSLSRLWHSHSVSI